MLDNNMPQMEQTRSPFASAPEEGGIGEMVGFALGLLRRQYVVIFVVAALVMSLALAYLHFAPPTYTARTQILLNNPKAQFVRQESPLAEPAFDLTEIQTQIQILKSSAIAIAVIKKLNLAADPDFNHSRLSLASIWRKIRGQFSPSPVKARGHRSDQPPQGLIGAFEGRLEARRASFSNIIEISYSSGSAARAAQVVNAVADAYTDDQLNSKLEANRRATAWLQDRLLKLMQQARRAEHAVDEYKTKHHIVSSGGKPVDEQQIAEFNSRLVAARAQAADALARLNRYEAIAHGDSKSRSSIEAIGATGSDALNSPIINSLRSKYLELQRRESEWAARFGKNHAAVVELRTRMRNLRDSIREEVRRLAETSRSDYEVAERRQQEIEKQLNEVESASHVTDSAEIPLRDLESQAKTYQKLYETFRQRYLSAIQQESFPIMEARVIYPALPPDSKSKPKARLILAFGAFGGLALGFALGLLRDIMDRVFRTPAQVETALQLPCLSVVPRIRAPKAAKSDRVKAQQPGADTGQRAVTNRNSIDSAVVGMPTSRFAETIRSTKMGIDLHPTKTANQVIGITSALPDEGKTTIAASLTRLIAHGGRRAIIVDCDLRNPSLSASLAPNAAVGIVEVVYGDKPLEDAIWRDSKTGFDLLPVVRGRPLFHTSEMLASDRTRKLFDRLRAEYDYVIVDLPPLSPLVDARATASFTDCFVLVIEWGRTKIDVVQHALHSAPNIYENTVGAVLNKTDIKRMGHYDSHRRDYYNDSYFARYGAMNAIAHENLREERASQDGGPTAILQRDELRR